MRKSEGVAPRGTNQLRWLLAFAPSKYGYWSASSIKTLFERQQIRSLEGRRRLSINACARAFAYKIRREGSYLASFPGSTASKTIRKAEGWEVEPGNEARSDLGTAL